MYYNPNISIPSIAVIFSVIAFLDLIEFENSIVQRFLVELDQKKTLKKTRFILQ